MKTKKKSFMNHNSILSEGFFGKLVDLLRQGKKNKLINKLQKLTKQSNVSHRKLEKHINDVNAGLDSIDKYLEDKFGIKTKSTHKSMDDFLSDELKDN